MMRNWGPAVAYMALIFALSSLPMPNLPVKDVPFEDKGVHFLEYAGLAFLVARACLLSWPQVHVLRVTVFAIGTTILWGVLDELHQAYVPNRSADLLDLLADSLGALCGAVVATWVQRSPRCRKLAWM